MDYSKVIVNLKKQKPIIIDVAKSFYGEEYEDIISKKIDNIIIFNNYSFLDLCQNLLNKKELDLFDKLKGFKNATMSLYETKLMINFPSYPKNLIMGNNFLDRGLIEYFDNYCDKKINSNSPLRKTIEDKRVEYYKSIGIDFGDDYSSYHNNKLCLSKNPTNKIIKKIKSIKITLLKEFNSILNKAYSSYSQICKKLKDLNLDQQISKDRIINSISSFPLPTTMYCEKDGNLFCVIFINLLNKELKNGDRSIWHELAHVLSSNMISFDQEIIHYQCGIEKIFADKTDFYFEDINGSEDYDDDELFGEIINDLISLELEKIAKNKNLTLFKKTKLTSSYEKYFPTVKPFYEEFKEEIKLATLTGDLNILYSKLNIDLYNQLKKLIREPNILDQKNIEKALKITEKLKLYKNKQPN